MTAQEIETYVVPVLGDMGYSTMPANLAPVEQLAYRKGFARADRAYLKASGGPGVVHDGDAPAAGSAARRMLAQTLAEQGRAYRIARHDKCHAAGMTTVRSYLRKVGATDRLEELTAKPARKIATRKPRAVKSVPVVTAPAPVDNGPAVVESRRAMFGALGWSTTPPVASPVDVPADVMTYPQLRAARKASNRELAAAMRAAGVTITAETWTAAKAGTLAEVTA